MTPSLYQGMTESGATVHAVAPLPGVPHHGQRSNPRAALCGARCAVKLYPFKPDKPTSCKRCVRLAEKWAPAA